MGGAPPAGRAGRVVEGASKEDGREDAGDAPREPQARDEGVEDQPEGQESHQRHAEDVDQGDHADQGQSDARERAEETRLGHYLLHPPSAEGQDDLEHAHEDHRRHPDVPRHQGGLVLAHALSLESDEGRAEDDQSDA